ncbi:hypothetical protein KR222_010583, partial [Zaprionus bogoriensis]
RKPTSDGGKWTTASSGSGADGCRAEQLPDLVYPLKVYEGQIVATIRIGQRMITATVDTGATRSFIDAELAAAIASEGETLEADARIILADGSTVNVKNILRVRVGLAGDEATLDLLILTTMLDRIILGMDFLYRVGTIIQCGSTKLVMDTADGRILAKMKRDKVPMHLRKANLTINIEKSKFCMQEVKYLGFVIGDGQLKTDPSKVEAINEFPIPKTVKQLRRFLGLSGWYRRFVADFATITNLLTELLKKRNTYSWNSAADEAFRNLKSKLTSAPILSTPDFSKPFLLVCDASTCGLGCVLAQLDETGFEAPIAFMSEKLSKAQRNYSVTELECLAVIKGIKKFRAYIEGQDFQVITDHASLQWLMRQKDLSGRLARWAIKLQGFSFNISHRSGAQNIVADFLSRQNESTIEELDEQVAELTRAEEPPCKWIVTLRGKIEKEPEKYADYTEENGNLYRHLGHRADDEDYIPWKLCVRDDEKGRVLQECHDAPTAGHQGVRKTIVRLAQRYYWPGMIRDAAKYVRCCEVCQKFKIEQRKPAGQMLTRQVAEPMAVLCADFVGPLPRSK